MSHSTSAPRVGIFTLNETATYPNLGGSSQEPAFADALRAAGATPVPLRRPPGCSWDELLDDVEGVLFAAVAPVPARRQAEGERLCAWCRTLGLPLLALGHALHALYTACGDSPHLHASSGWPSLGPQPARLPGPLSVAVAGPGSGGWYALGVRWLPAATNGPGNDLPLLRGLVEACRWRRQSASLPLQPVAA